MQQHTGAGAYAPNSNDHVGIGPCWRKASAWRNTERVWGLSTPYLPSGWQHPIQPSCGVVQSLLMTVAAGHRQQQGEQVLGVEHESQLGCPKVSAHDGCVLGVPLTALLSSGLGRVCKSYKHLDKCEHQIVPSKVKYQLHNMETQCSSTATALAGVCPGGKGRALPTITGHYVQILWGQARWAVQPGQQLLTAALLC